MRYLNQAKDTFISLFFLGLIENIELHFKNLIWLIHNLISLLAS
jgi:hypothetical protein